MLGASTQVGSWCCNFFCLLFLHCTKSWLWSKKSWREAWKAPRGLGLRVLSCWKAFACSRVCSLGEEETARGELREIHVTNCACVFVGV